MTLLPLTTVQRDGITAAITFRWEREQDMNAEHLRALQQAWEQRACIG